MTFIAIQKRQAGHPESMNESPAQKQWYGINHYPAVKTEIRTFDGEMVGGVILVDCDDHMFVESLHVRPQFRRKGFGRTLLEQCINGNHQKPFVLRAEPYDIADNGLSGSQLVTWYQRSGFRSDENPFIDGEGYLWLPEGQ